MKWSLLYSGFLMSTFLGTLTYGSPDNTTESGFNTSDTSGDLLMSQTTDGPYVGSSSAVSETQTTKGTTLASTTTTPQVKSPSVSEPCIKEKFLGLKMDTTTLLVLGGLTLGCVILLIIAMALAWKICHLKRHFRGYETYHIESSMTNGKRKANDRHEPDETTIMMSGVSKDNDTTGDMAEKDESKGEKEDEEEKNAISDQNSTAKTDAAESETPSASDTSDRDKSMVSEAKQPESSAEEVTKSSVDTEAKDATEGTKNETKMETEETTKTNAEAAKASEGSGTDA